MFLVALLVGLCMPTMAQRSYTFNVAAYNVDGLPTSILGVQVNKGGLGAEGAQMMAKALQNVNWDIVGISEDFNYHEQLVPPLSEYYHVGEHTGGVSLGSLFRSDCDGLGLLVAKKGSGVSSFVQNERVAWNDYYDNTLHDQGADGLVTKGFRYFAVTIAPGVVVDVYVLHMDAGVASEGSNPESHVDGGRDKNVLARENQLLQLREYIKNHNNRRHIFVIGDTNCRYTREKLKELFIDGLHSDDNSLTVRDAWVEMMWGGRYPTYGDDALMTHTYGEQRGEVVDKIFYIENSSSPYTLTLNKFERDMDFPIADHFPVVANFTITVSDGVAVDDWSIDGGTESTEKVLTGDKVENNGIYYLKNVSSGLYLKAGADYGVHAAEGSAGMPITFISNASGKYKLQTVNADLDPNLEQRTLGHDAVMNSTKGNTWTLEQVSGVEYQYYIYCDGGALTSNDGDVNKRVNVKALDRNNDKQKWILLSPSSLKTKMVELADAANPFDATPLIHAADFDHGENYDWPQDQKWTGFAWTPYYGGHSPYGSYAYVYGYASAVETKQTLSNMPAGKYVLDYGAFYCSYKKTDTYAFGSVKNSTVTNPNVDVWVSLGGVSQQVERNANLELGQYDKVVQSFAAGNNRSAIVCDFENEGALTISMRKGETSEGTSGSLVLGVGTKTEQYSWICVDGFRLYYYGNNTSDDDVREAVFNMLADYLADAWQEVQDLDPNKEGDIAESVFDLTTLLHRLNNGLMSLDGSVEKKIIDEVVEISKIVHKKSMVENAEGGDVTFLITNPSFEQGMKGWTIPVSTEGVDVKTATEANVSNADETHILDAFLSNEATNLPAVSQTITGIPNGLYEVTALMTTFGANEGGNGDDESNVVYLKGNSYHKGFSAATKQTFTQGKLAFLVEDATATIGAIGGNNGFYFPTGGFYRVDKFQLKYICDVPHGRLKLAIDEATDVAKDFDQYATLDIATYQTMFDNRTVVGDGVAEANAVYVALQAAAKQQKTKNADMTWAITNPNFELDGDYGKYTGWTTTQGWDTGVKSQDNDIYKIVGTDGRYLFNTWNDAGDATNSGKNAALTQIVDGIPNGRYRLQAMVASDANNSVKLSANSDFTIIKAHEKGKEFGVFPEVECEVEDHKLEIKVEGVGETWYKVDDFRLTFIGHELKLNHEQDPDEGINDWYTDITLLRNIPVGKWQPFLVPYTMSVPANWDVREFEGIELDETGVHLKLIFTDAGEVDVIEAGKPYMVRNDGGEDMPEVLSLYSDVVTAKTTLKPQTMWLKENYTGSVVFEGNYGKTTIPQGAYYISNNKFYIASKDIVMKGYRAYFNPDEFVQARVRSLGMGSRTETFIDSIELEDEIVIGIYDVNGVRLSEMKPGINILHMNSGATKKVVIK